MTWRKHDSCNDQQNGSAHNTAEQEQDGWNNRKRQCSENAALSKADNPNQAVKHR